VRFQCVAPIGCPFSGHPFFGVPVPPDFTAGISKFRARAVTLCEQHAEWLEQKKTLVKDFSLPVGEQHQVWKLFIDQLPIIVDNHECWIRFDDPQNNTPTKVGMRLDGGYPQALVDTGARTYRTEIHPWYFYHRIELEGGRGDPVVIPARGKEVGNVTGVDVERDEEQTRSYLKRSLVWTISASQKMHMIQYHGDVCIRDRSKACLAPTLPRATMPLDMGGSFVARTWSLKSIEGFGTDGKKVPALIVSDEELAKTNEMALFLRLIPHKEGDDKTGIFVPIKAADGSCEFSAHTTLFRFAPLQYVKPWRWKKVGSGRPSDKEQSDILFAWEQKGLWNERG
jgi:hypothetical protein